MPLGVQGRNIIFHNGTVAAIALGREHIEIVIATIWFAIALMEALLAELLTALGAEEMLRVPGFIQSGDAFLNENETKKIYRLIQLIDGGRCE